MTNPTIRIAQPGDIFILLVPSAQELHLLRQWQAELHTRYGGTPVNHLHITSQRFTPRQGQLQKACINLLNNELQTLPSFPVFTDRIIQFYARYWETFVLRWRVQETEQYSHFRDILDRILLEIECPSHFDRQRHASCGVLTLNSRVDLETNPPKRVFPAHLFTAQELLVSQLVDKKTFKIIETIKLKKIRDKNQAKPDRLQ